LEDRVCLIAYGGFLPASAATAEQENL